jgi:hypothetical protein
MKSISDVVGGAGLAGYAEIALIIFFLVFVAIGLRVLFARTTSFAHEAQLPLDEAGSPARSTISTRAVREEQ